MVVNFDFLLGAALGLILFDNEDLETVDAEWGFTLFLGPVLFSVWKPR